MTMCGDELFILMVMYVIALQMLEARAKETGEQGDPVEMRKVRQKPKMLYLSIYALPIIWYVN